MTNGATNTPRREGAVRPVARDMFVGKRWLTSAAGIALAGLVGVMGLPAPAAHAVDDCTPCNGGSISGVVFNDLDGNGIQNGEPGLAGETVSLLDGKGAVVGTVTTGAGGAYTFPGLTCGNYLVMVDIPTGGWTQTSPGVLDGFHDVHLGTQGASFQVGHFGLIQASCGGGNLNDVFNTGWDEANGQLITPQGSPDDDWLLTASYPNATCLNGGGLPVQQQHLRLEPSRDTDTSSPHTGTWNTPIANTTYVTSWPGNPQPNGEHYYQHCFCLADGFSNPALDFKFLADDRMSVYLNGTLVYENTTASNHFNQAAFYPLPSETVTVPASAWRTGINCVTAKVENLGAIITGFSMSGSVTADDGQCCQALVEPGAVKGIKYWDQNGNGVQDPGEPPLKDWPIELQDGNGNTLLSGMTDANGVYGFSPVNPGVWELHEGAAPSANWTQTEPVNPDHHTVTLQSGQSLSSFDFGNDGDICDITDVILSPAFSENPKDCCFNVQIDHNVVDFFTAVEVLSPFNPYAVMAFTPFTSMPFPGGVLFEGLPWLPTGFQTVGKLCLDGGGSVPGPHGQFSLIDAAGVPYCTLDLACGATVDGLKYNDEDGNGTQDINETGMGGWVIELVDATTGQVVATTTTAADGTYSFPGIPPGNYIVREVNQTGWIQTEPSAPPVYNLTLDNQSNFQARNIVFGNWADPKNDPDPDPGLCGELTGESIECEDALTIHYSATLTNLSDFTAAEVVVQHVNPPGYTVSPANITLSPALGNGDSQTLDIFFSSSSAPVPGTEICFFLTLHSALDLECCSIEVCFEVPDCSDCLNAIHGVKYHDKNGNGTRDFGEAALSGWQINVMAPDGTITSTVTDAWGNYWFTDLPHGVYTVWETQQTGWWQYEPATSAYTVTLSTLGGEVITDLNFGNHKKQPNDPIDPFDPTDPTGANSTGGTDGTGAAGSADDAAAAAGAEAELAPIELAQEKSNVALLDFQQAAPTDEAALVKSVLLAATGSGDAAQALTDIRLVHDLNANGIADSGEPVLANGVFAPGAESLRLELVHAHEVPAGEFHAFVVAGDFAGSQGPSGAAAGPIAFGGSDSGPIAPPMHLWLLVALMAGGFYAAKRARKFAPMLALAAALAMSACAGGAAADATYQVHLLDIEAVGATSGKVLGAANTSLGDANGAVSGPQFRVGE